MSKFLVKIFPFFFKFLLLVWKIHSVLVFNLLNVLSEQVVINLVAVFIKLVWIMVKFSLQFRNLFFHGGIPVILNRIVCPASQSLSNLSPSVPKHLVLQKEHHFFIVTPLSLFNSRVEVIVPSLSTLLPNSTWELFSNMSPLLRSVLLY